MGRKTGSFRREEISPDLKFNSLTAAKCINYIMLDGKKATAEKIFYDAMEMIKAENLDPMETFDKAVENIVPAVEVRSRRVGGSTYQVPIPVSKHRGHSLAFRWIRNAIRKRQEREAHVRLAKEIMDAVVNKGMAVSKKEDVLKMAEANRAFAHYRW